MSTLDANILALMNDTITWEAFVSQDVHGDASFAAPVSLACWVEEKGFYGGVTGARGAHRDVNDPNVEVYFDATDARVQSFDMRDRFTLTTLTTTPLVVQPDHINKFHGPAGELWVTVVGL